MSLSRIEQICPRERPGYRKALKWMMVRRERRRRRGLKESWRRRYYGYSY